MQANSSDVIFAGFEDMKLTCVDSEANELYLYWIYIYA